MESVRYLTSAAGKDLLQAIAAYVDPAQIAVADLARLRRTWLPEHIHAAITVTQCRRRAVGPRGKFPGSSTGTSEFWTVPEALQQATSWAVARHKATRFAALSPGAWILDACCGCGGDALGLAEAGPVLAIEADPLRAWLAAHNVAAITTRHAIAVIQGDVSRPAYLLPFPGGFHIDPARRSHGHRSADYAAMLPGPSAIEALIAAMPYGAVKLSPATDFADLPPGHLEIISENGVTVQAVLWTGKIAQMMGAHQHTATVLQRDRPAWSITGTPENIEHLSTPQAWLYEMDGAVTRSGLAPLLTRTLSGQALTTDGGYLTSAQLHHHPALTAFRVLAVIPYSQRTVHHWLTSHDASLPAGAGSVEIKTRGGLGLDTDTLQKQLKAFGPWTVLIYRGLNGLTAAITQRTVESS